MLSGVNLLLFDMDNTIVNTEELNTKLVKEIIEETAKCEICGNDERFIWENSWEDSLNYFIDKYKFRMTWQNLRTSIIERKKIFMNTNTLRLATGFEKMLELPQNKMIVSGSCREEIDLVLNQHRLFDFFTDVFGEGEYENQKPAPDGYLAALARSGCAAQEAIVFEDTVKGVRSAASAGIRSVFLREFSFEDASHEADFTFDNFESFYRFYLENS